MSASQVLHDFLLDLEGIASEDEIRGALVAWLNARPNQATLALAEIDTVRRFAEQQVQLLELLEGSRQGAAQMAQRLTDTLMSLTEAAAQPRGP